tara:strand:+ start:469 stop:1224 length:756 start_codon:yes stop_codon:yes gene_type:complete
MKFQTLVAGFAIQVSSINLKKPISRDSFAPLNEKIDQHAVAIFRNQYLKNEQLLEFATTIGPRETPLPFDQYGGVHDKITMLANLDNKGNLLSPNDKHSIYMRGNLPWHSDNSYKHVPAKYALLSALEVPSLGGETEFADARACYDDWQGLFGDIEKEGLESLISEHSIIYSRSMISGNIFTTNEKKKFSPVHQPLVRTHPKTKRKIYYIGSHCSHIVDWPIEKGRALVRKLSGYCIRPEHIYSHNAAKVI